MWDEALSGHTSAGGAGKKLGDLTVALDASGVRAVVGLASANLDTQLSAIDDYLDTGWRRSKANGSVDVWCIRSSLINVTYVNSTQVTGNGQTGTEWGRHNVDRWGGSWGASWGVVGSEDVPIAPPSPAVGGGPTPLQHAAKTLIVNGRAYVIADDGSDESVLDHCATSRSRRRRRAREEGAKDCGYRRPGIGRSALCAGRYSVLRCG